MIRVQAHTTATTRNPSFSDIIGSRVNRCCTRATCAVWITAWRKKESSRPIDSTMKLCSTQGNLFGFELGGLNDLQPNVADQSYRFRFNGFISIQSSPGKWL